MDLERSLANIKIDESPWRQQQQPPPHDQPQPWGVGGMQQQQPGAAGGGNQSGAGGWGGGHMSPQQMRNPWPEANPNNLVQNVNEALGLTGAPNAQMPWGGPMGGAPADFGETAKIWSDPHADQQQQFQPMHNHPRGMNGMMGDPSGGGGDWMGGPSQSQQPMWNEPMKYEDGAGYYKQQQGGWNGPPGGAQMGGGFRVGPPQGGNPRGHGGPQMGGMHMPVRVAGPPGPGGWNPQPGVYAPMGRPQGGPADRGMWNRGGGPPRMGGGRGYPPSGVDMSVPPPIDMPGGGMGGPPMGGQMNMRQVAPAGGMWKGGEPSMGAGGAPNGMRNSNNPYGQYDAHSQMPAPFGMPSKPQPAPGQFAIGGVDDLMWHDPNGDLKKWQRDTGVSLWGDPEKCNERPVRLWMVPEGEDEDIEVALSKCPVPQKRNEDGTTRLPFNLPSKRPIVVTGWGELPENDPNNPIKPEDVPSGSKWGDMTPVPPTESPWYLPGQQAGTAFAGPDSTGWGQPPGPAGGPMMQQPPMQGAPGGGAQGGPPPDNANFQQIADQLRYAVDKGYLDMSILTLASLPPQVLQNITTMLSKIPQLESVEGELKQLVESVRPEGEVEGISPQPNQWMNEVQKVEYNRLIIDVTTSKIEVTDLSKKINQGLAEAGLIPLAGDGNGSGTGGRAAAGADSYHYSFLE